MGPATESTGILIIFTEGCLLSKVVSRKNKQETHRVSSARDILKIIENFNQHFDLVQHDAFACVTIYLQRSWCKTTSTHKMHYAGLLYSHFQVSSL